MNKNQIPELVEISVSNKGILDKENVSLQASLKDITRLFNNLVRAAESAKNEGTYFSTAMKQITTGGKDAGLFTQKILVEAKELENVISALKAKNQEMMTGKGWEFDISSNPAKLVQGTVKQVIGEDAFKLLQAEAQARGGEAVRSPTKKSPDRVSYWYQSDMADEITGTHKTDIFKDAMKLSKLNAEEMARKAAEAERIKQEKADKAAKLEDEREQRRLNKTRSKQQLSTQTYNEKEEAKKADAERRFNERAFFMFSNMEGRERYAQNRQAEKVAMEKLKQQNRMEMFNAKQDASNANKKEQRRHAKITSLVKAVITLATAAVDLLRRLVVNSLDRASKFVTENVQGYSLGMTAGSVRGANIFDVSHGLAQGTTMGAIQTLQSKFGDITNLDEKSLGVLARVMGGDVAELVRSGLGGSEPEVLLEKILDKYFEQFKQGKNSLGQTVGQNQALRELVTSLSGISPELGTLLAKMADDYRSGAYGEFENYSEWRGTTSTNVTGLSAIDIEKFDQLGIAVDNLKGKFKDITDGILVRFGNSLFRIVDWISNLRLFMSDEEKLRLDRENKNKNLAEAKQVSALIASHSKSIKENPVWKAMGIKTSPEDLYDKNKKKFQDVILQDPELGAELAWLATLVEYEERLQDEAGKKVGSGIDLAVEHNSLLAEAARNKLDKNMVGHAGLRTGKGYADEALSAALLDKSDPSLDGDPEFALKVLNYVTANPHAKSLFDANVTKFAGAFGNYTLDAESMKRLKAAANNKSLTNKEAAELLGDIFGPTWGARNTGSTSYDTSIDTYQSAARDAFLVNKTLNNVLYDTIFKNLGALGISSGSSINASVDNSGGTAKVILEIRDPQGHNRTATLELGDNLIGENSSQRFIYNGNALYNAGGQ